MKCPVCGALLGKLFTGKILNKYSVIYYKCNECSLIRTEDPYWLDEAYSDSIADLDVGLVSRNIKFANFLKHIIVRYFDEDGHFLDYAGGYGLLVRMMRDGGFNFFREDRYCKNIFAKYFDISNCNYQSKFELITAFEFLEHVVEPVKEISQLLKRTDSVLFTTELQPSIVNSINDWWYFVPETGQHITFFSKVTLKYISDLLGTYYYTDGIMLHLFTKKKFVDLELTISNDSSLDLFHKIKTFLFSSKNIDTGSGRKSLTRPDFNMIKNCILNK